jgi:hypothetical protein
MRIIIEGEPDCGGGASGAAAPCLHEGQLEHGRGGRAPGCVASTLHRWGGRGALAAEKHPWHYRHVVGRKLPATSGQGLYFAPPPPPT